MTTSSALSILYRCAEAQANGNERAAEIHEAVHPTIYKV